MNDEFISLTLILTPARDYINKMKHNFSTPSAVQIAISCLFLLLCFTTKIQSQFPEAITLLPDSSAGFGEITLIFNPAKACVPDGWEAISGQDSILFSSSAVLFFEEEGSWDHRVGSSHPSHDGTLPYLYPYHDSLYSITFTPQTYYGTGTELIKGINARFKGPGVYGLDFGEEGCKEFHIPFKLDTVEVSFNVDMSYQIFLKKFDPFFDIVDVAGNFNNWGDVRTDLQDPDGDSIYSVTTPDLVAGITIEYRFRRNRNDGTSEDIDSLGYRTCLIQAGENNLVHWYNDLEPTLTDLIVNVNMNFAEEQGYLVPETDIVEIHMGFEHWAVPDSIWTILLSDPDSNGIYSAEIDSLYVGSSFNYIVTINGGNPFVGGWPWHTVEYGIHSLDEWWNDYDPSNEHDLFIQGYLDGEGNNNALEIKNPTDVSVDLSDYGLLYTIDGSDWLGPLKLAGTLESRETWLIVHPDFDFSAIDSALVVDTVWAVPCSFDGNDALALAKVYDGGNKWRILDQLGVPGDDPGTGWDVAGSSGATRLHRLERKPLVPRGMPDWNVSAGSSEYDSEWKVYGPGIPASMGKPAGTFSYDNLWEKEVSGVTQQLNAVASTDNGWVFAVGDERTAIYKEAGSTQWKSLSLDIPENYNLNGVFFTDSLTGWIVGDEGTILHTTNGTDWNSQSGSTHNLRDIFFVDSENGWVVGDYKILHTSDGGQTWEDQWDYKFFSRYSKVYFTDPEHGWIVSEEEHISYTNNGGKNWMRMESIPDGRYLDISFCNPVYGWIVGYDGIYATRDGGKTWIKQVAPDHKFYGDLDYYYGVHFVSPLRGWFVGDYGIFSTNDGGITWCPQSTNNENTMLRDVFFTSSNNGWAVGMEGSIFHTEDGWIPQNSANENNLKALFFTDDSTGWIVGNGYAVLKTRDAGYSWDTLHMPLDDDPSEGYSDIFFNDPLTGWFGGAYGTVLYTRDGGNTWDQHWGATNGDIYAVYFIDRNRGWAVGNGGAISRTTDGGESWDKTNLGNENFYDVFFVDSLHGWVVGEYGRILHSADGGVSWINQTGIVNSRLESVYFKDTLHGIAASDQHLIGTENGGTSWELSETDGFGGHPYMHFIDTLRGWIAGTGSTIRQTQDGGVTWMPIPAVLNEDVNGVFFLDENIGWVAGQEGAILRTSSGGCKDPFVNLPGIARVCEGEAIVLSGGDNYTYSWSTGSTDPGITASTAGWYKVEVGNRCGKHASDSVYLEVISPPQFQIVADGPTAFCMGEYVGLNIITDNPEMEDEYTFRWENDPTSPDKYYMADTTGYYSVEAKDKYGCSAEDSVFVFEQNPYGKEEICLVTIDLQSGKNLIVWNKTPDVGTIHYKVYREGSAIGQYDLIGTVPYDQLSIFTDTTSFPEARQYLYKISLEDSCGNESDYSQYHKPLFLQYVSSVGGVNLQWSDYVIEGNPLDFVTYEIYRGSDSISLNKLTEVPASLDRYIDTDGSAMTNKYYYRVAGVKETPCYPSGTSKAETEYRQSMSNQEDNRVVTGLTDQQESGSNALFIYPNPFTDKTLIQFRNSDHARYHLFITDLNGKIVKTIENITEESYELNSTGMERGIYFIELRGDRFFRRSKIIVN